MIFSRCHLKQSCLATRHTKFLISFSRIASFSFSCFHYAIAERYAATTVSQSCRELLSAMRVTQRIAKEREATAQEWHRFVFLLCRTESQVTLLCNGPMSQPASLVFLCSSHIAVIDMSCLSHLPKHTQVNIDLHRRLAEPTLQRLMIAVSADRDAPHIYTD